MNANSYLFPDGGGPLAMLTMRWTDWWFVAVADANAAASGCEVICVVYHCYVRLLAMQL